MDPIITARYGLLAAAQQLAAAPEPADARSADLPPSPAAPPRRKRGGRRQATFGEA